MYEYSYKVSISGLSLFTTNWYMVQPTVDAIEGHLVQKFPANEGYTVHRLRRSLAIQSDDITQPGGEETHEETPVEA